MSRADNSLCIGIDLGTTNSLIASCRTDNGKIITPVKSVSRVTDARGIKRNDETLPSCVYYQQDGTGRNLEPVVGDFAKQMHAAMPFRVAKSIKSQMGQANVTGLQEDISDKTPESISARIIRHLIADMEKYYGEDIKDAIITVPASFDPAQRLATLRAAEIAGLDVKNDDGSYDQSVLLSEPEAVMYYLLNEVRKGTCPEKLDFSTPKNVLVYDIGGGTLDITLHSVKKNASNSDVLDIDLIATNRFTPVAGDTFDKLVAKEMYKRYTDYYQLVNSTVVSGFRRNESMLLAAMEAHAEDLKIKINSRYDDAIYRHRALSDSAEFDCGGRMPNDYPYDDSFTKGDYERCVKSLLGQNYSLRDYKTIDPSIQTDDIIWPVLDVLRKAAKKLGVADVKVDEVLISGGMSRLYIIKERLDAFFGTNVVSVPNPDTAVAQGAVVYHYHLHQNSELVKKIQNKYKDVTPPKGGLMGLFKGNKPATVQPKEENGGEFLRIGKKVLSEPIYLGLKGGEVKLLADEGQDLPFKSNVVTGFKVDDGQQIICIPIQKRGFGKNNYVTIASGNINFARPSQGATPVALKFDINEGQIITIEAWTSSDTSGKNVLEKGKVSFAFGDNRKISQATSKSNTVEAINKPSGPREDARALLKELEIYIPNLGKASNDQKEKRKAIKRRIVEASNQNEFAAEIKRVLSVKSADTKYYWHLLMVSNLSAKYWDKDVKVQIADLCIKVIKTNLNKDNLTNNDIRREAIQFVCNYGDEKQLSTLYLMIQSSVDKKVVSPCIKGFATRGAYIDWIYKWTKNGPQKIVKKALFAIGIATNKFGTIPSSMNVKELVDVLYEMLCTENTSNKAEAIIRNTAPSIAYLCSMPQVKAIIGNNMIIKITAQLQAQHKVVNNSSTVKSLDLSVKLLEGKKIDEIDEKYLLSLLDEEDED